MVSFKQRGLRNNNPFNIKKSSSRWFGKKQVSSDPTFEQFDNMYYGLRAGMKLLVNYVNNGFNTPSKIIRKFAPNFENPTDYYIDYVIRDFRHYDIHWISPDEVIFDLSKLCKLASRIIMYENAIDYNVLLNIKANPKALFDLCKFYKFNLK